MVGGWRADVREGPISGSGETGREAVDRGVLVLDVLASMGTDRYGGWE